MNWLTLAVNAVRLRPQIAQLYDLLKPTINEAMQVAPIAIPLAKKLLEELAPDLLADTSFDAKWVQESLNILGERLVVDGDIGEQTKEAVKRFQASHGLYVDGWAGLETITALYIARKEKEKQP